MRAAVLFILLAGFGLAEEQPNAVQHLERYCLDCHDEDVKKGEFDLLEWMDREGDGTLLFENLITKKMPPANKKQPDQREKQELLTWLAQRQAEADKADKAEPAPFRRLSRHEFVNAANDLLGIDLDLAQRIPEDRGTYDFDSDRRIRLSREQLDARFKVAEEMLEVAFPEQGFPHQGTWVTDKIRMATPIPSSSTTSSPRFPAGTN